MSRFLSFPPASRARRLLQAFLVYATCTGIYFAAAAPRRLHHHTEYNHYALLADSWLHGRLDLGGPPPGYTGNNDFASYKGKWFVSFPPFPAVVLLPFAKAAGAPERLRDGQIWLWFAGVGPAVLFLALEKLRRRGHSPQSPLVNLFLAALFAFGTVYFFTAVQGTVWFAAHVTAVALGCLYLLFAIDADHPVLAGLCAVLMFATRGPPIALAAAFFGFEALRCSLRSGVYVATSVRADLASLWQALDGRALVRKLALFVAPIAAALSAILWLNHARFDSIWEFGHHLLTVGWRARIDRWGLFAYHFLPRNLGVMLTSLPYFHQGPLGFQINTHGLALWFTTPVYLWLLWPSTRRAAGLWRSLALTVPLVMGLDLLYQNSGWLQFGYRFSNDYAHFLFAMLAVGGIRFGRLFWTAALFAVAINLFGALTFDRDSRFYFSDSSQNILYQPD